MHNLSDYQRRKLLENSNVEKITEKHVVFTPSFQLTSVKSYLSGISPDQVFLSAKLNLTFFKPDYARYCIKKWLKKLNEQGEESFFIESRGSGSSGRPKKENLNELTYEELKAIVEIQRGVIEDLKKKRALAKKKS